MLRNSVPDAIKILWQVKLDACTRAKQERARKI